MKNKKKNIQSKEKQEKKKEKQNKYIYDLRMIDPQNCEYNINNIYVIIVDLTKFDINHFDKNDDKDLWSAFFKIIKYKSKYNKNRNDTNPKTGKVIIYDLTVDIYYQLTEIEEIVEALNQYEIKSEKIKVRYYDNFMNIILNKKKKKK